LFLVIFRRGRDGWLHKCGLRRVLLPGTLGVLSRCRGQWKRLHPVIIVIVTVCRGGWGLISFLLVTIAGRLRR
jgi:hypothetical protein